MVDTLNCEVKWCHICLKEKKQVPILYKEKGLCHKHYRRARIHGDPEVKLKRGRKAGYKGMKITLCVICLQDKKKVKQRCRGLCDKHYRVFLKSVKEKVIKTSGRKKVSQLICLPGCKTYGTGKLCNNCTSKQRYKMLSDKGLCVRCGGKRDSKFKECDACSLRRKMADFKKYKEAKR